MIVVKLQGGLGNQMFQYALGLNLAKKHNTYLVLDISIYKNGNPILFGIKQIIKKIFSLALFPLTYIFPHFKSLLVKHLYYTYYPRIYQLDCFQLSKLSKIRRCHDADLLSLRLVKEEKFEFWPEILTMPDNIYLNGYWQSEKFFTEIAEILRKDLVWKKKIENQTLQKIKTCNSVSIHFRRGDYQLLKENLLFGLTPIKYYKEAIALISRKIENPYFFIFSDDIDWVRKNLFQYIDEKKCTFITGNTGTKTYIDMYLMSLCKHNIITNSSFSWWAAWLNNNRNKIVIAPEKPFVGNFYDNCNDYYPETWIKIK